MRESSIQETCCDSSYPKGRRKGRSVPNDYRVDGDTVFIALTAGREAAIDLADFELVHPFRWHVYGKPPLLYAARTAVKGSHDAISLHLLLAGKGTLGNIDHHDGDGLNCRRSNLRSATRSQNNANQRKARGSSRFKGVTWDKNKKRWAALIQVNGKVINLGRFRREENAATAYNFAAIEHFGQFARANTP